MIRPDVKKPGEDEIREGRGFSIGEILGAGLTVHEAKRRGIPIDKRRRSTHEWNIQKLKEYLEAPTVVEKEAEVAEEAEEVAEEAEKTPITELKGLSKATINKLLAAGIEYVEDIVNIDYKVLAETTGLSVTTAKKVINKAKEITQQ